MKSDRRGFLLGTPFAALGFAQFAEVALAQEQEKNPKLDTGVVDFWTQNMGVPPHLIVGGQASRGRVPAGPTTSNFAREPLFLHYDDQEGSLIPASEIPNQRMHPFSDAKVQFQLNRMRLNPADDTQFHNYSSGAI